MKTPIAKADSVLAFMRFKGWELEEKTNNFYILKPPGSVKPASFRLKIPHLEDASAYKVMITEIVKEIAEAYDWNPWVLMSLLSKNPAEMEEVMQQGLLLQEVGKKMAAA